MSEQVVRLPTKDEIAELPRWAQVAFAARCARRVQPLFERAWPLAPMELRRLIDQAISLTESASADPTQVDKSLLVSVMGKVDADNAVDAHKEYREINQSAREAYSAHTAAQFAIWSAAVGSKPVNDHSRDELSDIVFTAVREAANCVLDWKTGQHRPSLLDAPAQMTFLRAVSRDYLLLRVAFGDSGWRSSEVVDPQFFGPMWPDGVPEGWPEAEPTPDPFTFMLDPGDADEQTLEEVLAALSELHEAHTGYALIFQEDGLYVTATTEVSS